MYFNWKKLLQSLPILGILFVSGTKQASAVGWSSIPILGDFWSFLGGALDNVAEGIVQGLVGVLGFIIQALGTLWINVANMVIAYGFELNSTLGQSSIIRDGFEISLAIVNIAFVLGLVIIAIVTMIRADWLVDTKKAIPRFIAAVLLINFSFFIGINLIINPVDSITRNIYTASQFDGNSFSHVFIPSIDLEPSIKSQAIIAQVASGEAKDNGTGVSITIDEYKKYIEFKSDLGASIKEELFRAEGAANLDVTSSERLEALRKLDDRIDIWILDPIDQTNLVANLAGGVAGRAAISAIPGLGVVGTVVGTVTGFASMFSTIKASWNDILVDEWDRGDLINAFNEVLDRIEVYKLRPENTSVNIADIFNEKVANYYRGDLANPSAACSINNKASQDTDACRALMAMAAVDNQELPLVTRISIALAQVLFKATFVFLGGFGLLAVGVMFIIRYIALSFLIILFPFAWIGWIFPKLSAGGKNIWTAWWSQFIRWVFFGPVSMFFFFLAVRGAIHIDDVVDPGKGLQDVLGGGSMGGIGEAFGNMIVVLGLLIGGVYAANKMGIMGSGYFMSAMKKTGGWAKNKIKDYSTKPIKFAGRKAKEGVKQAGRRAASQQFVSDNIKSLATSDSRLGRAAGRTLSKKQEKIKKDVVKKFADTLPDDPGLLGEMFQNEKSDLRKVAILEKLQKGKKLDKARGLEEWISNNETKALTQKYGKAGLYDDVQKALVNKDVLDKRSGLVGTSGGVASMGRKDDILGLNELKNQYESAVAAGDGALASNIERQIMDYTDSTGITLDEYEEGMAAMPAIEEFESSVEEHVKKMGADGVANMSPYYFKKWDSEKNIGDTEAEHQATQDALISAIAKLTPGSLAAVVKKLPHDDAEGLVTKVRSKLEKEKDDFARRYGISRSVVKTRKDDDFDSAIRAVTAAGGDVDAAKKALSRIKNISSQVSRMDSALLGGMSYEKSDSGGDKDKKDDGGDKKE